MRGGTILMVVQTSAGSGLGSVAALFIEQRGYMGGEMSPLVKGTGCSLSKRTWRSLPSTHVLARHHPAAVPEGSMPIFLYHVHTKHRRSNRRSVHRHLYT